MNMSEHDYPVTAAQEKEWIQEIRGMYAGLIAIAIVMIQPFMYEGEFSGTAAVVCVFSFAVSVPILASLLLLNYSEEFRHHLNTSKVAVAARLLGQLAALTGVVAGFWHIHPIAGLLAITGGIIGTLAYTAGYVGLYRKRKK